MTSYSHIYVYTHKTNYYSVIKTMISYSFSQVTLVVKNLFASVCDAGDLGSIPGLERSPGVGNGNPLQYSCLENSMDRGLAGYSPLGRKE